MYNVNYMMGMMLFATSSYLTCQSAQLSFLVKQGNPRLRRRESTSAPKLANKIMCTRTNRLTDGQGWDTVTLLRLIMSPDGGQLYSTLQQNKFIPTSFENTCNK